MPPPLPPLLLLLLQLLLLNTSASVAKEIWIGTSPFCDADPRDCPIFDMTFVRSDRSGDGKACLTGRKVLCRSKDLGSDLEQTDSNKLAVVTYNVFERPFFITHDGQSERTCHIPRALLSKLPDTDVIVFQEVFLGGCWYNDAKISMRAQLARYGFRYATEIVGSFGDTVQQQPFFIINGGVFIASRWPIVSSSSFLYANSGHADKFSKKGAVYAKVVKGSQSYHVLGTHMQAQIGSSYDKIRVQQAAELRQFVDKLGIPASQPVLLAGDFNCDRINNPGNVDAVLSAMSAAEPQLVGNVDSTFDYTTNEVVEPGHTQKEWLDYVVYSKQHRLPTSATQQALRLKADKPITYCNGAKLQPYYVWPWSSLCQRVKTTTDLSDHYPVMARFEF